MALTIGNLRFDIAGVSQVVRGTIDFDASYPTGGESLTPAMIGLSAIDHLKADDKSGYTFEFDYTNNKLLVYRSAGFTPAGTVDAPTFTGSALSTHVHAATGLTYTATDGSLVYSYAPGGGDIKGSANTDSVDVDQAAAPTNGDLIDTLHAVAAGAWSYSEDAEVDVPRNVCILLKAPGAGSTVEASHSFDIVGTFRGAAQTETITFSFADTSLAADQYRYQYGVKPYDSLTSVTANGLTVTQNDLLIGVGIGSKIGMPVNSDTGADADFLKLTKNAADLAVAGTTDHTNKTINYGALSNGDDVSMVYVIDFDGAAGTLGGSTAATSAGTPAGTNSAPAFTGSAVAATTLAEVSNGTNLSSLTSVRFRAEGA